MFRRNTVKSTGSPSPLGSGAIPQTLRAPRVMFASPVAQRSLSAKSEESEVSPPCEGSDRCRGPLGLRQTCRPALCLHNNRFSALERRLLEMGKKHLHRVFRRRPGARCPLAIICRPTPQCLRAYRQSNLKSPFPHLTAYACDRDGKAAATTSRAVLRCRAVHRWPCSGQRRNRSARQNARMATRFFQQAEVGY